MRLIDSRRLRTLKSAIMKTAIVVDNLGEAKRIADKLDRAGLGVILGKQLQFEINCLGDAK